MRTLLLFPPQAHFTQPYLALPSLLAYLRANGFEDTHQWDVNLESLEYLLSRKRLARARDSVRQELSNFDTSSNLSLEEMDRFKSLAEADLAADSIVTHIEDSLDVLRDRERFFNYDLYLKAVKRLDRAFKLISAEWYPTVLSANSFSMRYSLEKEAEVLAAAFDEKENPYIEFYRECIIPKVVDQSPDLIGISITYGSMVVPAFTLARMIKEVLPDTHITVGGGLLAYAGPKIARSGKVFDVIDSIVMLEGEGPLLGIAECIRDGNSIDTVGNVIHRKDGEVVHNQSVKPLEIDSLPTPDFDGIAMEKYFTPQIALPLAITRGCYYEKCVFCTLYKVIGPGYRQRSMGKILDDIEILTSKHDSNLVYFVVEDMPPVLFKNLPDALESRNIDIRWWTDARLEQDLYTEELCRRLHESGCRRIAFGFESASQRVLELMDKGTCIEEAGEIIRNVSDAGIAVVLYTMIGFPTETAEEARDTLAWIRKYQPYIQEVSLRIFYIDLLSTVYQQPEKFSISRIIEDPEKDYQVYFDHESSAGLNRAEARKIFFEFMEVIRKEFPLFMGDNLWLFELKSHHFLYLCHEEKVDVFRGRTNATTALPAPDNPEESRPAMAEDVHLVELPYDLNDVSQKLLDAEDATLRPRYQSGSFKTEMISQMQGSAGTVPPHPTFFVYRGATSDYIRIGRDAARILRKFDGRHTVRQVVDSFPEQTRGKVSKFIQSLFDRGLLDSVIEVKASPEEVHA